MTSPGQLSSEERDRLRAEWETLQQGGEKLRKSQLGRLKSQVTRLTPLLWFLYGAVSAFAVQVMIVGSVDWTLVLLNGIAIVVGGMAITLLASLFDRSR